MALRQAIDDRKFRLKKSLSYRRVLIDQNHLDWLLDIKKVQICLIDNWLKGVPFEADPKVPVATDSPLHRTLSNAITYQVCNELDCQPEEIPTQCPEADTLMASVNKQAQLVVAQAKKAILEVKPYCVILIQGYALESAALRAVCIEQSIPFVALENTARDDKILWENFSGITVNQNLAASYYWRYRDFIRPHVFDAFHTSYLKNQKQFKSSHHSTPEKPYASPDNKPLLTWIGQVYTDSSVLFGLNPGFKTPVDCIKTVLSYALKHDCRVFLKMHPKEHLGTNPFQKPYNRLTARKIREDSEAVELIKKLGNNVIFDDENGFDTFAVIEASRMVITINSQSGLESATRNVPVILCGQAFYGNLGFTRHAFDEEELLASISACLHSDTNNFSEKARCFNYIFFEKYCIPKEAGYLATLVCNMVSSCRLDKTPRFKLL